MGKVTLPKGGNNLVRTNYLGHTRRDSLFCVNRMIYPGFIEVFILSLPKDDKTPLPSASPLFYHTLTTWRSPVKDAVDSGCRIHWGLWGVKSREGAVKSVVRIHPLALKHAGACSRHENNTSGASPPSILSIGNSILFRISVLGFRYSGRGHRLLSVPGTPTSSRVIPHERGNAH